MCVCVCVCVCIGIPRQDVSLYHNSSVWLDTRDASSRDRNPTDFTSSDILLQTINILGVSKGIVCVYLFFKYTLSATGVRNPWEELCISAYVVAGKFPYQVLNTHTHIYIYIYIYCFDVLCYQFQYVSLHYFLYSIYALKGTCKLRIFCLMKIVYSQYTVTQCRQERTCAHCWEIDFDFWRADVICFFNLAL